MCVCEPTPPDATPHPRNTPPPPPPSLIPRPRLPPQQQVHHEDRGPHAPGRGQGGRAGREGMGAGDWGLDGRRLSTAHGNRHGCAGPRCCTSSQAQRCCCNTALQVRRSPTAHHPAVFVSLAAGGVPAADARAGQAVTRCVCCQDDTAPLEPLPASPCLGVEVPSVPACNNTGKHRNPTAFPGPLFVRSRGT